MYIFNAINGLWRNGAQRITALDIESYLEANDAAKKLYEQQNGLEYLQDIEEFSNIENFPYYYPVNRNGARFNQAVNLFARKS